MASGDTPAHRVRRPASTWVRQHVVQVTILAVVLALLFACCNLPAWPTVVWYAVGHDCGTVLSNLAGVRGLSTSARQDETCFARAYHHCAAAKLTASFTGVDSSASYTFVIEPYGFTCAVGALWIVGGPGIGYCSGLRFEANGLRVLGCQSIGDIFVASGA